MMTAARVGSFLRCAECYSLQPQRNVGSVVDTAAGSLRGPSRRSERLSSLKRNVFPQGLKLAPSQGSRHVVLERYMKALLCCNNVDTEGEVVTHENVEYGGPKVKVRLRVDHQIQFGEHVALLGSTESAGSWNNRVMMVWTQDGWVVDLEADPGETIEHKYIIITKDGNVVWEDGENRVMVVPDDFSKRYEVVSHWSSTSEAIDFEVIDTSEAPEGAATELKKYRRGFKVVGGIQSSENGAIGVEKEINEAVVFEVVEETEVPRAVATEPELGPEIDAKDSAIVGNSVLPSNANDSEIDKNSAVPYNANFSKPKVEGDLSSSTWWGPVSILLSILVILYGFVSLPKN